MPAIDIIATWDNLPVLTEFADEAEATLPLSHEQVFILRLVIEEIVTNVIKYGYNDSPGPVTVDCSYADDTMTVCIRDRARPFDPREAALPDLTSDVETRGIGGLGVFLVLDMVDTLDYVVGADGWNTLTVTKRQTPLTMFAILRRISLFAAFTDEVLAELADRARERHLLASEVLFDEGDSGYDCFVLLAGRLQVIKRVGTAEITLDMLHPGAIVGEMALLDRSPRSATVRAISDCRLLMLDENSFYELMHGNPAAALDLLRGGTARLRSTTRRMVTGLEKKNAQLARAYEDLKAAQADQMRLERIRQELEVARRIQEVFLPRTLPQPPGWQIAARNRGAEEVGGDFYDCIELGHAAHAEQPPFIGLVLADVCGKGVPAALFVALTRSLLRAASQWTPPEQPDAIVARALQLTNDYIAIEHEPSNMFITMFYGVLDPTSGTLFFVNAGHNPPLLVRARDGAIVLLPATDLPVGILAGRSPTVQRISLDVGDLLVAFTDGVTEALNVANEEFGDSRLLDIIATQAGSTASATLNAIEQAVRDFAGSAPQTDDITLLVVSRSTQAPSAVL